MKRGNKLEWLNDDELADIDDDDFYRTQGAVMTFIELLDNSNDSKHIHHMWIWLIDQLKIDRIDERLIFVFFRIASDMGYSVHSLSGKLIRILIENRIDIDDDEAEWLALIFSSTYFDESVEKKDCDI